MTNNNLWRKEAIIVMRLAEMLSIDKLCALDLFFRSRVHQQLVDPRTGLYLMSDGYILQDLQEELAKVDTATCPKDSLTERH